MVINTLQKQGNPTNPTERLITELKFKNTVLEEGLPIDDSMVNTPKQTRGKFYCKVKP